MSEVVEVEPTVVRRLCGGWLATSPPSCPLKIGVTALSEDGARADFKSEMARFTGWLSLPTPQEGKP